MIFFFNRYYLNKMEVSKKENIPLKFNAIIWRCSTCNQENYDLFLSQKMICSSCFKESIGGDIKIRITTLLI